MQVMKCQAQYVACLNDTESSLVESLKVGGVYQHYRNKQLYRIESIGRHTETEKLMVVYKPLYIDATYQDSLWIRPLSMFCDQVAHEGFLVPRFQYRADV